MYGTVPLTEEIIRTTIDGYIPLVNLNYICAIKDKEDKIVSFGIMVPSIAKALKKSNGKILPFGIVRLLRVKTIHWKCSWWLSIPHCRHKACRQF